MHIWGLYLQFSCRYSTKFDAHLCSWGSRGGPYGATNLRFCCIPNTDNAANRSNIACIVRVSFAWLSCTCCHVRMESNHDLVVDGICL